ncbi:hypothetical protein Drorol1_Dr00014880 [Drosera rotundifolia]
MLGSTYVTRRGCGFVISGLKSWLSAVLASRTAWSVASWLLVRAQSWLPVFGLGNWIPDRKWFPSGIPIPAFGVFRGYRIWFPSRIPFLPKRGIRNTDSIPLLRFRQPQPPSTPASQPPPNPCRRRHHQALLSLHACADSPSSPYSQDEVNRDAGYALDDMIFFKEEEVFPTVSAEDALLKVEEVNGSTEDVKAEDSKTI